MSLFARFKNLFQRANAPDDDIERLFKEVMSNLGDTNDAHVIEIAAPAQTKSPSQGLVFGLKAEIKCPSQLPLTPS